MKMKSKFFGLNAKLALAVLAVGTMFTSCYDSENGDVAKPYVAPDAVYSFQGVVTNNITGEGVEGATIAFTGAVTGTATTDAWGNYELTVTQNGGVAGTVNMAVSGADFEATTATVEIEKIGNGQSIVYFKNIVVNYTSYLPEGVKINTSNNSSSTEQIIQGEDAEGEGYIPELDVINNTNEPMIVTYNFEVMSGSRISEDLENVMGAGVIGADTRVVPDEAKADIKAWIVNDLGMVPTAEFGTRLYQASFTIPALQALKYVSVSYTIENQNYNYSYGTESGRVVTQTVLSVMFNANMVSVGHYHGHGHGHGNGENAGGGIILPEL